MRDGCGIGRPAIAVLGEVCVLSRRMLASKAELPLLSARGRLLFPPTPLILADTYLFLVAPTTADFRFANEENVG